MNKFVVEKEFWDVFPDAKLGIVICKGIDNNIKSGSNYESLLRDSEKIAMTYLNNSDFSKNPAINVWRLAFQQFKTKKGARSSIEALLKRVKNDKLIGSINPLVDIYNSISLKYAMPCGGEDIDTFVGDVKLTKAIGDEAFVTLGSEKSEPPNPEEIVYKDDEGAICRCFNWRESVRTMLTEETKNAFLCIELMDNSREDEFNSALRELDLLINRHLGGQSSISIIDINNKEITL